MLVDKWQMQDAKAKLSEVISKAKAGVPQVITVRGIDTVVMISMEDLNKLMNDKPNFIEFINNSPLKNSQIKLKRDKSLFREIEL